MSWWNRWRTLSPSEANRLLLEFVLPSLVWPIFSAALTAAKHASRPCVVITPRSAGEAAGFGVEVTWLQTDLFLVLLLVAPVMAAISTQVASASVWLERRTGPRPSPTQFLDRLAWGWGLTSAVLVEVINRTIAANWPC